MIFNHKDTKKAQSSLIFFIEFLCGLCGDFEIFVVEFFIGLDISVKIDIIERCDMLRIFTKEYSPTTGNTSLFALVCFTVFIIPLFPITHHSLLYNISYTVIFFMAVIAVDNRRKLLFWGAMVAVITEWLASYFNLIYLEIFSHLVNLVFFAFIVSKMIYHIVRSKIVNVRVIIEAINGYLLIGFIFTVLVTFSMISNPASYNFPGVDSPTYTDVSHVSEYLYYAFVTFTTLGYGDIVPKTPGAKSLAIFISITGQIYIAIIMALLVGKFATRQNEK